MTGILARLLGPSAEQRAKIDLRASISAVDYVAFDTELTGLDQRRDSIISIGALKLHGGRLFPTRTFYRLMQPESELKHEGVVVHEITHTDLENAQAPGEVLRQFVDFIGDAVLIGHFVHIDTGFVNLAMKRHLGFGLRRPAIDTAALHEWLTENDSNLAKHYGGVSLKNDLFSIAERYGIVVDKAHNAFADAYITAQLFQRFLSFLPRSGVITLKDLLSVSKP